MPERLQVKLPVPVNVPMPLVRKFLRYASVSAISTVVSLSILGTLVWTGATTAGWANVIATGIATIPSFELNRRWVWRKTGRRSVWAEMGPFFVWTFAELGLSTYVVSGAVRWATLARFGVGARTFVAEVANVATFGLLWVLQFVLLDRILFRNAKSFAADSDAEMATVETGATDTDGRDDHDGDGSGSGEGAWLEAPASAGVATADPAPGFALRSRRQGWIGWAQLRQELAAFRADIAMALRRS